MRKNKLHITTTVILSVLITFLFTSCFDPIYHSIRIDVKPEKPTVNGHAINSIARYNIGSSRNAQEDEYLVLGANGGLRYKTLDNPYHGQWNTYSNLPFSLAHGEKEGYEIAKVLADKDTLYIFAINYKEPVNVQVWASKMPDGWSTTTKDWKNITGDKKLVPGYFNAFYTNDPVPDNRKAYLRMDEKKEGEENKYTYTYYTLSSTAISKTINLTAEENYDLPVNSVIHTTSGDKYFNSIAVATDGTNIYCAEGENLRYGKAGEAFTNYKTQSAGAPIASLAVCKDSILVGCGVDKTTGGLKRATLTPNGDGTFSVGTISADSFTTNAKFQIQSAYQIPCLLNAIPGNNETKSQIYATVTFPGFGVSGQSKDEDKGLWSYYPNRGNWNRE